MTRASLLALSLLAVACYEPEAIDCTVSCSGPDECADGQVCGADGFCAAPSVAGHCTGQDNGESQPASLVMLEVYLDGEGKIVVESVGECDERSASDDRCVFSVTPNVPRELRAIRGDDSDLEHWFGACAGETPVCTVTPTTSVTRVGAKFR